MLIPKAAGWNKLVMRVAFVLLVVLCATVSFGQRQSLAAPDDGRHIVTLGDSITKGVRTGVSAKQTFAALVETDLLSDGKAIRVTNVGIGGERTDQALKRLDKVLALKPDIVTVMYGTNDSYIDKGKETSRISLDTYRANLSEICAESLRRGILPVLMTEPRWADNARPNGLGENPNVRLEPYIKACREVARQWRVPLIDHFATWSAARNEGVKLREWTTDGCHPNPAGHRKLAALMLPVLRDAIPPQLQTGRKLSEGQPIRVVCFGDSVTGVYYHTGSRRAYTDMLGIALERAGAAKVEMFNAGISGNTTVNALSRIQKDVLSRKPDLVTVMFGLNDMVRVPIDTYRSNLKTIVDQCRGVGAEVVLATPNNVINTSGRPTKKLIQYCDVVREVAQELNVPLADCYREFDAIRANDDFYWRLLMSDAIHPNMDGHQRIAVQLAQTITGQRVSISDTQPPQPAIARTLALMRDEKQIRVLAMAPFDRLIRPALAELSAEANVAVTTWPTGNLTLAELEQDAKTRVRALKPDLVVVAIPREVNADSDGAFVNSYAWVMNWSLNFGPPTWDCIVVHPSVTEPQSTDTSRDDLVRRLVGAQDLSLIDRTADSSADAAEILRIWLKRQMALEQGD